MSALVREFHESFDIPILGQPSIPDIKRVQLRQRLLREEFKEADAEFDIIIANWFSYVHASEVYHDLTKLAKELSDVRYVAWGADLEFGIPSDAVDLAVHKSNMSKLGPDGRPIRRHDGKVIKGPNYYEPDLLPVLGIIEGSTTP